jgi:hypothetical protein
MVRRRHRLIQADGLRDFDERVASQLAELLERLLDSPKHTRVEHPLGTIPRKPGVYLFCDAAGQPVYVGQSRNIYNRLAQQTRDSSSHVTASFAFNIARREAAGLGIDIVGFREELVARDDFNEQFLAAKRAVAKMPVQFAVEEHADLRTVFEGLRDLRARDPGVQQLRNALSWRGSPGARGCR